MALLGAGIIASLYKGWDYEEACVLAVFLAALIPCRREFYRHASLFSDRFTLTWISGIGIVVLAMLVLTLVRLPGPEGLERNHVAIRVFLQGAAAVSRRRGRVRRWG